MAKGKTKKAKSAKWRLDTRSLFKPGERAKLLRAASSDSDSESGAGGNNRLRFNLGDGGTWCGHSFMGRSQVG